MSQKKYLVVGGVHDGQWVEAEKEWHTMRLMDPLPRQRFDAIQTAVTTSEYHRIRLADSLDEIYEIYIAPGVSPLRALIEGYKPTKPTE